VFFVVVVVFEGEALEKCKWRVDRKEF